MRGPLAGHRPCGRYMLHDADGWCEQTEWGMWTEAVCPMHQGCRTFNVEYPRAPDGLHVLCWAEILMITVS